MKKTGLLILLSSIVLLAATAAQGQEQVRGLPYNPALKGAPLKKGQKATAQRLLSLPIIDDFSYVGHYPTDTLWADQFTFVNQTYPYQPPSIGAATFDALDENGIIYPGAGSDHFQADKLTSQPIDLAYPGDTTIYLSFYYQAQGYALTPPEEADSLVLYFYAPANTEEKAYINEIYHGLSPTDCWIEIYNGSSEPMDIGSYYISNDPEELTKYKITGEVPDSTTIDPYCRIVLRTDSMAYNYPLSLDMALNMEEGNTFLALSRIQGDTLAVIDSLTFSQKRRYASYGRFVDGSDSLGMITTITRGDLNPPWDYIWSARPDSNMAFRQAMIAIGDDKYKCEGFRFRFCNYASIINPYEPSWAGNNDMWHLDYVKLGRGRTPADTILYDVAMSEPLRQCFDDFIAMPWDHFTAMGSNQKNMNISFSYANNHAENLANITRFIHINDQNSTSENYLFNAGALQIFQAGQVVDYQSGESSLWDYSLPETGGPNREFLITAYLNTNEETYKVNDTVSFTQYFTDYYAFDDGTAEASYGFNGSGTDDAQLAYRFELPVSDTLTAVWMHFVSSYSETEELGFLISLWSDDGGMPGSQIYLSEKVNPIVGQGYMQFATYEIEPQLLEAGTYYVGWQQLDEGNLNVGLDVNNNRQDRIYYSIAGQWKQTGYQGALMIRPVFGYGPTLGISDKLNTACPSPKLYPNPVNRELHISMPGEQVSRVDIYNSAGLLAVSGHRGQNTIAMGHLPAGLYFVVVYNEKGQPVCREKIMKTN